LTFVQKLFGFEGRIRRRDFWIYSILVGLFTQCLVAVAVFGFGYDRGDQNLALGLELLTLWPTLAITVKRLHDRNKSGWFCLLFYVGPSILGEIFGRMEFDWALSLLIGALILIPAIWGIVELGFRDSVPGTNRFGPSPKKFAALSKPMTLNDPTLPGEGSKA